MNNELAIKALRQATHQEYIPGVCNIGAAERARRRLNGVISSLIAIILLAYLLIVDAPVAWRLLLIVPIAGAASGFLQDAMHFCAGFGLKGIYNVINSAGVTDNVDLEEFRKKDQRKALQIAGYSLAIGVLLAGMSLIA